MWKRIKGYFNNRRHKRALGKATKVLRRSRPVTRYIDDASIAVGLNKRILHRALEDWRG